jgi:hypothetical protein
MKTSYLTLWRYAVEIEYEMWNTPKIMAPPSAVVAGLKETIPKMWRRNINKKHNLNVQMKEKGEIFFQNGKRSGHYFDELNPQVRMSFSPFK